MIDLQARATLRKVGNGWGVVATGTGADVINRLVDTTFRSAVQRAPRSGHTRRGPYDLAGGPRTSLRHGTHRREYATPSNLRGAVGNISEHAQIVHDGRRAIQAPGDRKMYWVNDGGPYHGSWRVGAVRGAKAQPWIVDAYNAARGIQGLTNVRPMNRARRPLI